VSAGRRGWPATIDQTGTVPWSPLPQDDDPRRHPRPLAEGLDQVLAGLGAPPVDALSAIRDGWAELVGPEAALALRPASIRDGRLVVVADGPAWASQARWLTAALVAGIEARCGPDVVTDVAVRVGPSAPPG
jgi:predicted nucleic acid-binding Zn ribbon protein